MDNLDLGGEFILGMLLFLATGTAAVLVIIFAIWFTIEATTKRLPVMELVIYWLLFLPPLAVGLIMGTTEGFVAHFFFLPFQVALIFYRKVISSKNKSHENT